jgi:hypothetical protein
VLQFKGSISVFYREDFSARKENFRVISDDFVGTVGVGISIFEFGKDGVVEAIAPITPPSRRSQSF